MSGVPRAGWLPRIRPVRINAALDGLKGRARTFLGTKRPPLAPARPPLLPTLPASLPAAAPAAPGGGSFSALLPHGREATAGRGRQPSLNCFFNAFGIRRGARIYGTLTGTEVPLSKLDSLPTLLKAADGRATASGELSGYPGRARAHGARQRPVRRRQGLERSLAEPGSGDGRAAAALAHGRVRSGRRRSQCRRVGVRSLGVTLPSFGADADLFVPGWVQAVRHNVYGFALWESLAER